MTYRPDKILYHQMSAFSTKKVKVYIGVSPIYQIYGKDFELSKFNLEVQNDSP